MLVDQAKIIVRSGKGGDGAVAFRREKFINKGGPSGGDGGKGGDVILEATQGVDTLLDFAGRHDWNAKPGGNGAAKQCTGAKGDDLLVKLPPGTLVYNDDTGELIDDLDAAGKRIVFPGGKGGFGNEHFKSPTHQAPRQATPGEPGVELHLRLELKLIADVGLVGLPNAGKSTLLSRISRARPKVADYPFTTLEPNLGIAELPGNGAISRRLVIADIPGLIEGAHQGQGLGTEFLRHIERTRVLVHLLDAQPTDGSDPVRNYLTIRKELAQYSQLLADKPQLIALSKMDMFAGDEARNAVAREMQEKIGRKVIPISAVAGTGLNALLEAAWEMVRTARAESEDVLPQPSDLSQ
jgi:GTPase